MPIGKQRLQFGGVVLEDGVYAMVEVGEYQEGEPLPSDLFLPLTVEVDGFDADGDVKARRFYLANTDAIVGTCAVVPNIGGAKNAYFQVKPRQDWSDLFVAWLREPHDQDVMDLSDVDEDEEES